MSITRTIYQTSFRIDSRKIEQSAFFIIQKIIYNWISEKEKCKFPARGKSNFFRKLRDKNLKSGSIVNTYFVSDDNFSAWGCEYSEFPSNISGKILTEIVIKEIYPSKTVLLYVNISLVEESEGNTNLGPSIPRFIRRIVSSDYLDVYSGDKSFKVGFEPIIIKCGQGQILREWIDSELRKYPIFVFNSSSDTKVSDAADKMAKMLIGKAQVFILDDDPELIEELSIVANKALYCIKMGYFKLFYPKYGTFIRTEYAPICSEEYGNISYNIIKFILKDLVIQESGAFTSTKQIINAIEVSNLLRLNKERSILSKTEIDDLILKNDELKAEISNLNDKIIQLTKYWEEEASSHDSLKEELSRARIKIESLNCQIKTKDERALALFREQKIPSKLSLNGICTIFEILYKDRIIIPQSVLNSLSECKFDDFSIFWEMLSSLTELLYDKKFTRESSELNKLDRIGRFEYAATEGKMTNKDKKLTTLRKIELNGKTYDISAHIKYGNRPPKCIRIHFAYDDNSKKIIIGFIGTHMPNYISKTR